jgi:hypothetical protein
MFNGMDKEFVEQNVETLRKDTEQMVADKQWLRRQYDSEDLEEVPAYLAHAYSSDYNA